MSRVDHAWVLDPARSTGPVFRTKRLLRGILRTGERAFRVVSREPSLVDGRVVVLLCCAGGHGWLPLGGFWSSAPRKRCARLAACHQRRSIQELRSGISFHSHFEAMRLEEMLEDLTRRASQAALSNLKAVVGDARQLPYPDRSFDAAYLISILGEIPCEQAALRELHRVLKRGGRLVVGEIVVDPDFISVRALQERRGYPTRGRSRRNGRSGSESSASRTGPRSSPPFPGRAPCRGSG